MDVGLSKELSHPARPNGSAGWDSLELVLVRGKGETNVKVHLRCSPDPASPVSRRLLFQCDRAEASLYSLPLLVVTLRLWCDEVDRAAGASDKRGATAQKCAPTSTQRVPRLCPSGLRTVTQGSRRRKLRCGKADEGILVCSARGTTGAQTQEEMGTACE